MLQADAKLSPVQCESIIRAWIAMFEKLQRTGRERRQLLQGFSEVCHTFAFKVREDSRIIWKSSCVKGCSQH